jgi:hypothetical protein
MQRKITVCNRLCEKDKCPHHVSKVPFVFNRRFIEYNNFEGTQECLRRKEVRNDIQNRA